MALSADAFWAVTRQSQITRESHRRNNDARAQATGANPRRRHLVVGGKLAGVEKGRGIPRKASLAKAGHRRAVTKETRLPGRPRVSRDRYPPFGRGYAGTGPRAPGPAGRRLRDLATCSWGRGARWARPGSAGERENGRPGQRGQAPRRARPAGLPGRSAG